MDFAFTQEQLVMRKTIIDFARQELNPGLAERDRLGLFPRQLWEKCAEMRLLAMPFPEQYGGDGFDFVSTVAVYHALGYASKDSGLVHALMTQIISGLQILLFGSEELKAKNLPNIASGKLIYAQAITEPGSGSDALAMRTTARKVGDGYILNGTKTMISNGPVADRVLIFAVTDPVKKPFGGVSCFIVSQGDPGFSAGKPMEKMGLRTLTNGELVFSDCRVPSLALIGREGQGSMLFGETMEWERTLIPACLLGELERIIEECVKYAKERQAFGQSIGDFQAISHKLARMKMNAELGALALYSAAALKNRRKRAAMETSTAKLFISESLKQAALDAVQIRGGYGYMSEYDAERELRDSIASTIYSGTSEMQLNIIARLAGL
jgi:alkylation response protein AidB-like acyl-CoA dehydrogenase